MPRSDEVSVLIREARKLDKRLALLKNERDTIKAERKEKREALQALVLSGKSTGDPIRDYIIVRYGGIIDPVRERIYKQVNRYLKGKQGQLVAMLVYENRRIYGPHDRTETIQQLYFAVLRGEELKFTLGKTPSCTLPIDSYAKVKEVIGRDHLEIVRKPFREDYTTTFEVMKASNIGDERPSDTFHIALCAGTKAVRALSKYQYLSILPADRKLLRKAEQDLGLLELESESAE